jgi:RND family efflux transporter MFP subunit
MAAYTSKALWIAGAMIVVVLGGYLVNQQVQNSSDALPKKKEQRVVPVEVARVMHGPLSFSRTFSGTIDPRAQFAVAPKVGGRIQRILVDVSDPVIRGQVVVQMENAEFEQDVIEAEARLAVAEANRDEAVSRFAIARRQLDRAKELSNRGIASDSAYDSAQDQFLTGQSAVKVAGANLSREEALLRAARIRLAYTQVKADWKLGDSERTVAERFVEEGNTVAANTPILSIVEIDPVVAVIQITEKDYPLISLGQEAKVQADGFPGKSFIGTVTRISPIFNEASRQAEIELQVDNADHLLKPGMYVRCTLELVHVEDAVSVAETAITRRSNRTGVFRVIEDSLTVAWIEVKQGFTSGNHVQLLNTDLTGRVVTMGQQFIEDGSKIRIVSESTAAKGGTELQ